MKTTERFDNAVRKLYTAFHEGTLDAMDCEHCAVGNLCDNRRDWFSLNGLPIGDTQRIPDTFRQNTGYSNQELVVIEHLFIYGTKPAPGCKFYNTISNPEVESGLRAKQEQRELQFQGLCAVVEYLAELDGIPNPFDLSELFGYDKAKAEKQLELI
jgi:hypothetical protein